MFTGPLVTRDLHDRLWPPAARCFAHACPHPMALACAEFYLFFILGLCAWISERPRLVLLAVAVWHRVVTGTLPGRASVVTSMIIFLRERSTF